MNFEFNGDLSLEKATILNAFLTMKESIDKSLVAVNETIGDYMTVDFMEKYKDFIQR